jgi:hypothetical protein
MRTLIGKTKVDQNLHGCTNPLHSTPRAKGGCPKCHNAVRWCEKCHLWECVICLPTCGWASRDEPL